MTLDTSTHPLRRAALVVAVLSVGCFSRWSGCRSYEAGSLSGPGWSATVQCAPHTEVSLRGVSVLRGCTTRWAFAVERAGDTRRADLRAPRLSPRPCGAVRSQCATAHGELAQRVTGDGTWVAARPPGGSTRVAFVPSACGRTHMLPEGAAPALSPEAAVARQPEGPAFLDGLVAREPIWSPAWSLVCGPVLARRLAAVRAAMLQCRVPEEVARELFRADPASVEAAWRALIAGRLPCARPLRTVLREVAMEAVTALALGALAECRGPCPPGGRVGPLHEAGAMRLPGLRAAALRLASPGPPAPVAPDAPAAVRARYVEDFDVWLAAQWALSRIDPPAGTELALATLRRLSPPAGGTRLPVARDEPPAADYDDPSMNLCTIVLRDGPRAREGLWQIAGDAGLSPGTRQRALLALASLGDPRATGETLSHNPLTAEQSAVVRARVGRASGSSSSTGGHRRRHHHHHWH